MQLLQCLDRD